MVVGEVRGGGGGRGGTVTAVISLCSMFQTDKWISGIHNNIVCMGTVDIQCLMIFLLLTTHPQTDARTHTANHNEEGSVSGGK